MNTRNKNTALWIFLFILSALAIELRLKLIGFQSSDFEMYTSHWMQYLRQNGPFYSFAERFSNYSPAYIHLLSINNWLHLKDLFFIKYISFLFEISAALAVYKLVSLRTADERLRAAAVILFLCLPTVLSNSGQWAQCDIIYTSFALWSFYFLMSDRKVLSLVFLGAGFAFKLQTVFVFPFYFLLALHKDVKMKHLAWLIIPFLLTLIPSWLAGRSGPELLGIYFSQDADQDQNLSINTPNIYSFFNFPEQNFTLYKWIGIALTAIVTLYFVFLARKKRLLDSKENYLSLIIFFSILVPFFLPRMHERYFFMAEIFTLVYCFYHPRKWPLVMILQVIAINTYFKYLYGFYLFPLLVSSFLMLGVLVYFTWMIFFSREKEISRRFAD